MDVTAAGEQQTSHLLPPDQTPDFMRQPSAAAGRIYSWINDNEAIDAPVYHRSTGPRIDDRSTPLYTQARASSINYFKKG